MKVLLATLFLPMILGAQTPAKNTWTVTAVAGPISWPGHSVKISIDRNDVSFTDPKAKRQIVIRGDQITQVAYSRVRFSRAQQIGGKYDNSSWSTANMPGCGDPGCGGILVVALLATAIAAPMHGSSHFILLTWVDRDVEQQVQFEIRKSDAEAINSHLRDLAGVHWIDVYQQQQLAEREISDHGNDAIPLALDRDSSCGVFAFPKGFYRLLVTQNGHDVTVYFFAAEVNLSRLRGILSARISGNAGPGTIEYAEDSSRIASIPWQGKSVVFPER